MPKVAEKLLVRHFEWARPGRVKTGLRTKVGVFEKNEKVWKMRLEAVLREVGPFGSSSARTSTAGTRWKKTTLDQVGVPRCARCQELLSLRLASKWPSLLLSLTNNYEFNQTILIPKFTNCDYSRSFIPTINLSQLRPSMNNKQSILTNFFKSKGSNE